MRLLHMIVSNPSPAEFICSYAEFPGIKFTATSYEDMMSKANEALGKVLNTPTDVQMFITWVWNP